MLIGFDATTLPPHFSICIVTYQTKEFLRGCLLSIAENTRSSYEVIVVDNGSTDGTPEMLQQEFPAVLFIQNQTNLGYTYPMNQALRRSKGRFLFQLNPDTLLKPGALDKLGKFLEENPRVGIVGPKVLNADGSLQAPCRRGEPRPWALFSYFSGLAKIYPKNPRFSEYLLTYLDENETNSVAGVSGSCMGIRREMVDEIGYLDERFFAYQEDADFCFRARAAGWQVIYYPEVNITHFGGMGGSHVEPLRSIYAWHWSYYLYYRKHLAKDYFFIFNWIFYLVMFAKFLLTVLANAWRKDKFGGSRKPG